MKTALLNIDMGDCVYSMQILKYLKFKKIILSNLGENKFNIQNANFIKSLFESQKEFNEIEIHDCNSSPLPNFDLNYSVHPNNKIVAVGDNLVDYHLSKFNISPEENFLNQKWINIENPINSYNKKLCISRSLRYRGRTLNFYQTFLQTFNEEDITFIGLEDEYEDFCNCIGKKYNFFKAETGIELANKINEFDIFLGNQSLVCSIATGLGKICFIEYGINAANYIYPDNKKIFYFI